MREKSISVTVQWFQGKYPDGRVAQITHYDLGESVGQDSHGNYYEAVRSIWVVGHRCAVNDTDRRLVEINGPGQRLAEGRAFLEAMGVFESELDPAKTDPFAACDA
jgi:hypothetical protein